jgi:hypothetical protein
LEAQVKIFTPTQSQIVTFLRKFDHGYITTVARDQWPTPPVLVGFSANDELEIMFGTDEISGKAQNLEHNPRVGFGVTDVQLRYQVTMKGLAHRLTSPEYEARKEAHYAKLPGSRKYENEPGQVFYLIRPALVLFRDCNPEHSRDWHVTSLLFP